MKRQQINRFAEIKAPPHFAYEQRIAALEAENERVKAVAIKLAEAADVAHDFCCDFEEDRPCTTENCQVQKALADWAGLFPKEGTVE